MRRALAALPVTARLALADGRDVPPGLPCECKALIKGDQRSQSIAAASIVAKVDARPHDAGLRQGRPALRAWKSSMGYATERHRAAIEIHGRRRGLPTACPSRPSASVGGAEEEIVDSRAPRTRCSWCRSETKIRLDQAAFVIRGIAKELQFSLDFQFLQRGLEQLLASALMLGTAAPAACAAASTAMSTALERTSLTASRSPGAIFCSAIARAAGDIVLGLLVRVGEQQLGLALGGRHDVGRFLLGFLALLLEFGEQRLRFFAQTARSSRSERILAARHRAPWRSCPAP